MNNIEFTDVVLDMRAGDSGKACVTYDLLKKKNHNLCVKFNGGPNAGNTIYINTNDNNNNPTTNNPTTNNPTTNNTSQPQDNNNNNTPNYKKMVLHMLPIGMAKPNVYNLISSDCVVDIEKLKKELEYVKSYGFDITGRIFISKACHIITNDNINYDLANNLVGTTGSGIAPTYANKMLRIGKRVEDYREEFESMGVQVVDMRKFWDSDFVKNNITGVLLQGSQGFELDINWCGTYPYCTSSTCTLAGAINTGFPLKTLRNVYGVAKMYDTYVGSMVFQPPDDSDLVRIGDHGREYGSTTGRRRQCNYLNLDALKEGLLINNCNVCIINKVDIIADLGIFKLYYKDELKNFYSLDDMKNFILQELRFIDEVVFSYSPYMI
jgi:adenylosuccinate synthase